MSPGGVDPTSPDPVPDWSPGALTAFAPSERPVSGWLPWALILAISGLAFLLASFPARNTDLWLHLAEGKRLAEGHFPLGQAANPTWLYDLIFVESYSLVGDNGIVLAKALLAVVVALGLLYLSRANAGWSIAAICSILAILMIGARLLLQPATVSYAMFVACLLLEMRNARRGTVASAALVTLLFLIWANLDSWFILGLAAIALHRTGRVLDQAFEISRAQNQPWVASFAERLPRLFASLALLALVCLLNPAHVHAFRLPMDISESSRAARYVFENAYFTRRTGLNPAGLAYFPLLGLGLLSFAINYSRRRWQWILPWTGLAVLSVFEVRAIPFFAIVAAPATAWNLQEYLRARYEKPKRKLARLPSLALRLSAAALLLALLASAWPGWLQAGPFEPRRWTIETPPSLQRGAQETRRWHEDGSFGKNARGLHLSADSAHAFAWFCPDDRGMADADLTATILKQRSGWEERLRAAGINHVIVYDADRSRLLTAIDRFINDSEQWPLLFIEGDLAVFGWRDPLSADVFRGRELDVNRLALRPRPDKKAPGNRPAREPEVRQWWQAFWKPLPPRSLERDEATLSLHCADAMLRTAAARHHIAWTGSQYFGIVAAAGGWSVPGAFFDGHLRFTLFNPLVSVPGAPPGALPALDRLAMIFYRVDRLQRDDSPAAWLYLSIRAARRAVAVNPDDAHAHLILGKSYLRLVRNTRERAWVKWMPQLADLRYAQASAALNQAVKLDPELKEAHQSLADLYVELGCLDLALEHQRAYFSLIKAEDPPAEMTAAQYRAALAAYEQELNRESQSIENRLKSLAAQAPRLRVFDRAALAMDLGLGGKARDTLLASDVAAFGYQGMALELELLLRTGRAKDVREWMGPEQRARLGVNYFWLKGRAYAASGDYALAQETFAQLAAGGEERRPNQLNHTMAAIVGEAVLDSHGGGFAIPNMLWRDYPRFAEIARELRQQADASVLRGLMALEEGDITEAARDFRRALATWRDEATTASGGGLDFSGRVIAQGCLAWIE